MEAGAALPPFWAGGPAPGQTYIPRALGHTGTGIGIAPAALPAGRTLSPMVTGTSVLGLKFSGGVMLAADTVGSYGSLARFRGISRLLKVNDSTVLGASGDLADFQHLRQLLEQMDRRGAAGGRAQLQPAGAALVADAGPVQPALQDQSPLEYRAHRRCLRRGEFPGLCGHAGRGLRGAVAGHRIRGLPGPATAAGGAGAGSGSAPNAGGGAGTAGALPEGALLQGCSVI
uniref:Proteasome subunit beta n=1 Tax=Taeniopygia guttata TaxID=59729 RepID=B5G4H0_TAEGU|nr:putative proteasome beta 4 subunit [Taeniopygia guttata]